MQNPVKSHAPTWSQERSGRIRAIGEKYRDRRDLADAQGLKVDNKDLIEQKNREIKAVLTPPQYKNYLNIRNGD